MCRLFGLQATWATQAACELIDAQNALVRQSHEDARGLSNPHGWGVGQIDRHSTSCVRQVEPATDSSQYRREALRASGTTVLAHVRRATVGEPSHDNTHPFRHGDAMLIHNGHVPAFDRVRPRLRDRLSDARQRTVQGTTDSEHVLALLLQLREDAPDAPLRTVTRAAIQHLQAWCEAVSGVGDVPSIETRPSDVAFDDPASISDELLHGTLALNLLWTDGTTLAGSRLNRTLYRLTRSSPRRCPLCGTRHAEPTPTRPEAGSAPQASAGERPPYRSIVFASEPITDESWTEVPNGSVFDVTADGTLHRDRP